MLTFPETSARLHCSTAALQHRSTSACVWLALDKSSREQDHYDVAYVDRNGNGDLVDEGEKITATADEDGDLYLKCGRAKSPASGFTIDELTVNSRLGGETVFYVECHLQGPKGRAKLFSGMGAGHLKLQFGWSPQDAPILFTDPWGPLSFQLTSYDHLFFGQESTFSLCVGTAGPGPATFSRDGVDPVEPKGVRSLHIGAGTFVAVDEHFLDLQAEEIWVTLTATNERGATVLSKTRILEHC